MYSIPYTRHCSSCISGENVLHMSAVAEDPTMVKYLLDQGIEIHEKCYGNFFCADDQKMSRNDSLEHEEVDLCVKTDYQGFVYWGEYPLCFAGVLHQEECFRLILSRGANPDLQVQWASLWLRPEYSQLSTV